MFKHLIPLLTVYLKIKEYLFPWIRLLINPKNIIIVWLVLVVIDTWIKYPTWSKACLVNVVDGDTIKYRLAGDNTIQIGRLWHIDAFEKSQTPWGLISQVKLKNLLAYTELSENSCLTFYVKTFEKDRYSRNLVLIKKNAADHQTINEKMLVKGWALIYPATTWPMHDKSKWKKTQEIAQIGKLGIWKYSRKSWKNPWEYRRRQAIAKIKI